jgi:hypothetical protein
LLRFFDRVGTGASQARPPVEDASDSLELPPVPDLPALTLPASMGASAALTAPFNAAEETPAAV